MDSIYQKIGQFGRYQAVIYFLTCFCSSIIAPSVVVIVFSEFTPEHRCYIPSCDNDASLYEEDFLNFTIPFQEEEEKWAECSRFEAKNVHGANCRQGDYLQTGDLNITCDKWVYDRQEFTSTTVTEFDLVCKRSWLKPLSGSAVMLGMLIGASCTGYISDRYGRKFSLLLCILFYGIFGMVEVVSPYYSVYLLGRFVKEIFSIGIYYISFIVAIEFVGPKWRTFCGILFGIPYALFQAASGILAYYVRDFRWLLFYIIISASPFISYYWLLPESIRWLLAKDRKEEVLKIIQNAAKTNRLDVPNSLPPDLVSEENKSSSEKLPLRVLFIKLVSLPNMRKRTLFLYYGWNVSVLVYFGISLTTGTLSGNIYLNFVASMLIEIPGYIFSYLVLDRFGRKGPLCAVFLVCGAACIIAGFLPQSVNWLIITMNLIGKFGISAAFSIIVLFTSEIYPTECRSFGVGACSTSARIGGILAPFLAHLSEVFAQLPVLIFGGLSFIAGLAVLGLPETAGAELPQTLLQSENFGLDQPSVTCCSPSKLKPRSQSDEDSCPADP